MPKFNKSYQEQNPHRQNTLVHRAAGAENFLCPSFFSYSDLFPPTPPTLPRTRMYHDNTRAVLV